jgi:hypothetical protein
MGQSRRFALIGSGSVQLQLSDPLDVNRLFRGVPIADIRRIPNYPQSNPRNYRA